MKSPRAPFSLLLLVPLCALVPTTASAQSYGPDDQVLTIGAAEFRSRLMYDTYIDSDGYAYYDGDVVHVAPLPLPEGALIEEMCLYANDSDPGRYIETDLVAVKLVPGGEGPDLTVVGAITRSTSDIGYGYYCSGGFSSTLRGRIDIDNDGILDAVAYYVYALIPSPTQSSAPARPRRTSRKPRACCAVEGPPALSG